MKLGTKVPIASVVVRNSALIRFSDYPGTGTRARNSGLERGRTVINHTIRTGESGTHVTELLNQVREWVLEAEVWGQRDEVAQVRNVPGAVQVLSRRAGSATARAADPPRPSSPRYQWDAPAA